MLAAKRFSVLIFGQRRDPHVQAVIAHLNLAGVGIEIVDQWSDEFAVDIDTAGGLRWPVLDRLREADGVAIWNRSKSLLTQADGHALRRIGPAATADEAKMQAFWRAQWIQFGQALIHLTYQALPRVRVLNGVAAGRSANFKPVQLVAARRAGFSIPTTTIGNSSDAILARGEPKLLIKSLSNEAFSSRGPAPVAELPVEAMIASGSVPLCPVIYQNRIEKAFELRVNVAGTAMRATRIRSQEHNATALDWRVGSTIPGLYEEFELPASVAAQIKVFMTFMQLDAGALDFAVTPQGEYVFFECNPAGQWLWIEEKLGTPISHDLAELLMRLAGEACDDSSAVRPAAQKPGDQRASLQAAPVG